MPRLKAYVVFPNKFIYYFYQLLFFTGYGNKMMKQILQKILHKQKFLFLITQGKSQIQNHSTKTENYNTFNVEC